MSKRYSDAERKAFSYGRVYALAKKGKRVNLSDSSSKKSFSAGYKSVDRSKSK